MLSVLQAYPKSLSASATAQKLGIPLRITWQINVNMALVIKSGIKKKHERHQMKKIDYTNKNIFTSVQFSQNKITSIFLYHYSQLLILKLY